MRRPSDGSAWTIRTRRGTRPPARSTPTSDGRRARSTIARIARASVHTGDDRILLEIISTVASSLDLDDVLPAVVRLLSDAAAVHACFVYLIDEEGERLVLEAASEPYAHLVGDVELPRGEGLAWWAAERRRPGVIRENALDDPRTTYVPELEEERFQSLVAVPVLARDGNAIGAITLHTEAPREFTDAEVDVIVSTASLVGGAIENARLYEVTRRRVRELEHLTELAETAVRADSVESLLAAVAARCLELLRATSCHVYLLDADTEELRLAASAPPEEDVRRVISLSDLGPELARSGRHARVAVPLVANDELLGLLVAEGTSEVDLARAAANQTAVALKKIELIERLTETNLIKDFLEDLAGGKPVGNVEGRAARLGFDLDGRYVVVEAAPADEAFERALSGLAPRSLVDRRGESLRALVKVPPRGERELVDALRRVARESSAPVAVGVSNVCSGVASFAAGFAEARDALLGTAVLGARPGVMAHDELGPYKYLLRMSLDP
ncbi:MAG: GAF domain-containing protein, partial [Actinobacteria bacterium]|nr:GAF domain-containing protein [Actinomycetota bacterium]